MVHENNVILNNRSLSQDQIEINFNDQVEIPSTNYKNNETSVTIDETNEVKKIENNLEKGSCLKQILQVLQIWWFCEQLGLCDINFN